MLGEPRSPKLCPVRRLIALLLVGGCVVSAPALLPASAPGRRPARTCPIFPAGNPLNQEILHTPVNPRSAEYIAAIGANLHLHPDFGTNPSYGIPYTLVGRHQPRVPIHFTAYGSESNPGPYPVPLDAPVEGAGEEGDRHVLVLQEGVCKLYELYGAHRAGAGWDAASGAVFNLRSNALRPDGWTSADAAGLPILPLLVRYDEVRAGGINHALRVTVPRTQAGFVHPRRTTPPRAMTPACRRWACACGCGRASTSPPTTGSRS